MRWSIRYQLLIPPLTLLCGVVGMSTWAALSSAGRARHQLETQVREHHLQLRRRLESIRRIHQASDELEERIAELEQARDLLLIQQDGLSGQIEAIDDIVEMPDAWPMAANSAAA